MKIKVLLVFIILPIISFAKPSQDCNSSVKSHPDMSDCIQTNTKKTEDSIKETIVKSGKEYSIDVEFYNNQRKSISERCGLYNHMEGQRAEFLENQCEYDGIEQLNTLIKNYMMAVDNY